jgi:hypothetical protein
MGVKLGVECLDSQKWLSHMGDRFNRRSEIHGIFLIASCLLAKGDGV